MRSFLRLSVILCAVLLATTAFAAEVFMPRFPAISPDGQTVVFSFQGDLWSVAADGGQARRLTAHEAYDSNPVFSPDGKQLAFASDRYGNRDIYLMPASGGAPSRVTYSGVGEAPSAFSPDGKNIYYSSSHLFDYPMARQIFTIPAQGGTPQRLVNVFGDEVATSDGKTFIIAEGRVKPMRLRYRGTYQREIYSWSEGSDPVRLTENRGYDMNPMTAPDGRIYWIGDQNKAKCFNIYSMAADGSDKKQLTKYKDDGIRSASLSADGQTMVFERGTAIYTLAVGDFGKTGKAREMKIQVAADAIENPVVIENKTAGASEMAVSSDGEEFALIIDGEIVLVSKELGGRATVAVPGPHRERDIAFKPGTSDTLMFVTDRFGEDQICLLIADVEEDEDATLRTARQFKIIQLTDDKRPATGPDWSPDGERILYTQGNADLRTMDADGDNDKLLFKHWSLAGYNWSPDGNWVAFSRNDANFNTDIMIIPSTGGDAVNITRHPDYDENPVWSADGSMLAWTTTRHNPSPNSRDTDVYFVYLQRELDERTVEEWKIWEKTRDKEDKPGKGKGKKEEAESEDGDSEDEEDVEPEEDLEEEFKIEIDFEEIYLRSRRLTRDPGGESAIAIDPKGDRIYFTRSAGRESDLYSLDRFGEEEEQVTKGNTRPSDIQLDADGKKFTFLKNGKPSWTKSDGGKVESTDFSARLTIDRPAVRLQVLDEGWRMMRDSFYDEDMHGVDWPALRKKYGAWVQKVGHDQDFGDVVNFMLGELNASHMGYYPNWKSPGEYGPDGYLGLRFSDESDGDGLVISFVLPHGPCDLVKSRLLKGDVLVEVDGLPVSTEENLYAALTTRGNLPTWVKVIRDGEDGKEELEFEVVPVGFRTIRGLAYRVMENSKRAVTEEATDGKVGYVHIQGMGWSEVERFEQNLFAAADGKEALIIDVRNNGGGWTTDLLLTILTQPQHAYTIARDGEIGYPQTERQPFFRWSAPIAVICNEGSYSNAEIFSHAVKTIGRGPVIGWETGGNVISTGGFGNRYNGYIRMPFRGWYVWGDEKTPARNHKNQEGVHDLTGFIPDYPVQLTPADRLHGRDPQLQKAIELMQQAVKDEAAKPQREDRP